MPSHAHAPPRWCKDRFGRLLVLLWLPAILVPTSLLMASHLLTLPAPVIDASFARSVQRGRDTARPGTWFLLHVLAADCACSRDVAAALLARGADPTASEKILFIEGSDSPAADAELGQRLRARGFAFERLSAVALEATYGIVGAPLLVVMTPAGEIAYTGGYSRVAKGPAQDVELLRELRAGRRPAPLPLFGCAVSRKLQTRLDPLGLKYRAARSGDTP